MYKEYTLAKGSRYENANGTVIKIIEVPDKLGQVTFGFERECTCVNVGHCVMVESFVSMMKDNGYIEVSTDMYRIAYYYNDCTYELFTHIDLLEDTVKDLCGRGCAINCIERI